MPTVNPFLERQAAEPNTRTQVPVDSNGDPWMDFCQFCDFIQLYHEPRDKFRQYVQGKMDRIIAQGGTIDEPFMLPQMAWYAEWQGYELRLERQEEQALERSHW